jgi:excisionase family DNA binding protein
MQMRTVRQSHAELLRRDDGCQIGLAFLYGLVRRGEIPHVRAGKRILIDMDRLTEYLSGQTPAQQSE